MSGLSERFPIGSRWREPDEIVEGEDIVYTVDTTDAESVTVTYMFAGRPLRNRFWSIWQWWVPADEPDDDPGISVPDDDAYIEQPALGRTHPYGTRQP